MRSTKPRRVMGAVLPGAVAAIVLLSRQERGDPGKEHRANPRQIPRQNDIPWPIRNPGRVPMTNLTSSVPLKMREVFPAVAGRFAAARAFQIHDAPHARIDWRDVQRAAGFQQDGKAGVAQRSHQRQGVFLQKRFAAGQFHQGQPPQARRGGKGSGQLMDAGGNGIPASMRFPSR